MNGWMDGWTTQVWRTRASIPVPLACKASALPFELVPLVTKHQARRHVDLIALEYYETCVGWQFIVHILSLKPKSLTPNEGLEPATLRLKV